jgi:hypothetical protein
VADFACCCRFTAYAAQGLIADFLILTKLSSSRSNHGWRFRPAKEPEDRDPSHLPEAGVSVWHLPHQDRRCLAALLRRHWDAIAGSGRSQWAWKRPGFSVTRAGPWRSPSYGRFGVRLVVSRARGPTMYRLRIIGVVAVAACVGGCARTWVRTGAEAADLDREKFECQFEATKIVTSAGTEGAVAEARRGELESLCMEAKGWSLSWGR